MVVPRWVHRHIVWHVAAIVIALGLMFWVLHESAARGRLARHPRVDDVIYMARGAELVWASRKGLAELVSDWSARPPHSPWSSGSVAVGAVLFGASDASAYALTWIPPAVFLSAVVVFTRRVRVWPRLMVLALAAAAPFLAAGIHNLKPDYFCGVLTATGMAVALRGPVIRGPARRPLIIGVFFGLALLTKPSMVLPTLMLLVGTLGICAMRDVMVDGFAQIVRLLWARVLGAIISIGVCALVAAPHFAVAARGMVGYTAAVLGSGGTDRVWGSGGSWAQSLTYYLTGPGGRLMIGPTTYLPAIVVILGIGIFGIVRRLRQNELAYLAAWLLALLMAYAGPTISSVKIAQFAAPLHALLVLAGIHAASVSFRVITPRARWITAGVLAACCLFVAVRFEFTFPRLPEQRDAAKCTQARLQTEVVEGIAARTIAVCRESTRPLRIAVTGGPAEFGQHFLTWRLFQNNIVAHVDDVLDIPPPGADTGTLARELLGGYDLVIANQSQTGLTQVKRSRPHVDAYWLAIAQSDADLKPLAQWTGPGTDRNIYLFQLSRERP